MLGFVCGLDMGKGEEIGSHLCLGYMGDWPCQFLRLENQLLCKSSVKMRLQSMALKLRLRGRKDHGSGRATSPLPVPMGVPQPLWKKCWEKLRDKGLSGSELHFASDRNTTPTPISRIQGVSPWNDLASLWARGTAGSALLSASPHMAACPR